MYVINLVHSVIAIPLIFLVVYYIFKVIKNFQEHEEVSKLMFFLREEVLKSFRIFSYCAIFYAVTILADIIGMFFDLPYFGHFIKLGLIVFFVGGVYFARTIATVTSSR